MEKPSYILASEIQDILDEGKQIPITYDHIEYLVQLLELSDMRNQYIRDVRRGNKEMTEWLSKQFNEITK